MQPQPTTATASAEQPDAFHARLNHYRLLTEQLPAVPWSSVRDLRYTYVAGAREHIEPVDDAAGAL